MDEPVSREEPELAEGWGLINGKPFGHDPDREAALSLLAVLHRDGGQHTAEVGFQQSCWDAQKVWEGLQERLRDIEAMFDNNNPEAVNALHVNILRNFSDERVNNLLRGLSDRYCRMDGIETALGSLVAAIEEAGIEDMLESSVHTRGVAEKARSVLVNDWGAHDIAAKEMEAQRDSLIHALRVADAEGKRAQQAVNVTKQRIEVLEEFLRGIEGYEPGLNLPALLLERAFQNTVELLKAEVEVEVVSVTSVAEAEA